MTSSGDFVSRVLSKTLESAAEESTKTLGKLALQCVMYAAVAEPIAVVLASLSKQLVS